MTATMVPWVRRLLLTAHVTTAVGWTGAVLCFLALATVGVSSQDPGTVRGVYLVMEPVAWYVLVPLALMSLVIGVIQSLGTTWGLFRHYWVLIKLVMTVLATAVLLMYTKTVGVLADLAADPGVGLGAVRNPSPMLHAALALPLLLAATVLAVYKPRGVTGYGR